MEIYQRASTWKKCALSDCCCPPTTRPPARTRAWTESRQAQQEPTLSAAGDRAACARTRAACVQAAPHHGSTGSSTAWQLCLWRCGNSSLPKTDDAVTRLAAFERRRLESNCVAGCRRLHDSRNRVAGCTPTRRRLHPTRTLTPLQTRTPPSPSPSPSPTLTITLTVTPTLTLTLSTHLK